MVTYNATPLRFRQAELTEHGKWLAPQAPYLLPLTFLRLGSTAHHAALWDSGAAWCEKGNAYRTATIFLTILLANHAAATAAHGGGVAGRQIYARQLLVKTPRPLSPSRAATGGDVRPETAMSVTLSEENALAWKYVRRFAKAYQQSADGIARMENKGVSIPPWIFRVGEAVTIRNLHLLM